MEMYGKEINVKRRGKLNHPPKNLSSLIISTLKILVSPLSAIINTFTINVLPVSI
jgi:hypothetical protein